MSGEHDPWPPGYGQFDVAEIIGVTLVDNGHRAIVFMSDAAGLKIALAIPLGDLVGAVRQLTAHIKPAEVFAKRLVAINGGKA